MSRASTAILPALLATLLMFGCGGRALRGPDAGTGKDGATKDGAMTKDGDEGTGRDAHDGDISADAADAPTAADIATAADVAGPSDAADARDAGTVRNEAGVVFASAVTSFCEEKAQHWCAFLTRCRFSSADDADCRAEEQARCAADVDVWQATAASRDRLGFDTTKEADCFAALDEADCANGTNAQNFPLCNSVYVGKVADGQPCVHAAECLGGFCDAPFRTCAGTCASFPKVGARCRTEGCGPAASCDLETFLCQPKKPLGAACGPQGTDSCTGDAYCLSPSGWACGERDNDNTGCHCAAPGGAGATCKDSNNCGAGLGCVQGLCRAPGNKGDACNYDRDGGCAGELVCRPTPDTLESNNPMGFCIDRLPDGAACVADNCLRGSECAGEIPVCRPIPAPALGEACEPLADRCPLDTYCDNDSMKCLRTPRVGESCEASGDRCWGAGLTCLHRNDLAVCQAIPTLGNPCSGECAGEAYCANLSVCMPKLGKGAPCEASGQCLSEDCGSPDPATCGNNCRGLFCTEPCS